MDYLLEIFEGYSVNKAITLIAAIVFLIACYRKIEGYFTKKAIADKEKNEQFQEILNQVNQNQLWHQQTLDAQKKLSDDIAELKNEMQKHQEQLERMEEEGNQREQSKLRDRLLQSYRYYSSDEKNPAHAWSEMEAEAFWLMYKDYEKTGGNGHIHSVVKPGMRALEVIPMHENEKIAQLMNSRK